MSFGVTACMFGSYNASLGLGVMPTVEGFNKFYGIKHENETEINTSSFKLNTNKDSNPKDIIEDLNNNIDRLKEHLKSKGSTEEAIKEHILIDREIGSWFSLEATKQKGIFNKIMMGIRNSIPDLFD